MRLFAGMILIPEDYRIGDDEREETQYGAEQKWECGCDREASVADNQIFGGIWRKCKTRLAGMLPG